MVPLVAALVLSASQPTGAASGAAGGGPAPAVSVIREFDLSSATGTVKLTWPNVAYDPARGEIYVIAEGFVRIFTSTGMEAYRFGDDGSLGTVTRIAVLEDGNIIALSMINGQRAYLRLDYRGELITRFGLTGLPPAFQNFNPDSMLYRNGRLYFAERPSMRVVVTEVDGTYRQSYALADLVAGAVRGDSERRPAASMDGFGVDPSGNLLITMSVMFAAGVVSPSGEVKLFGSRGSTPGRFNNVGAIDADERGYIYVTDRLRAVVSVWSKDLKHLGDFGYRGYGPTNLITPYELVVGDGRVVVAQAANRGVKVYRVNIVEPEPPPVVAEKPPPRRPPARRPASFEGRAAPAPEPDRDGDGIPDRLDKCPDQFGPPPDGCPKKKYTLIEVKKEEIRLKQQVRFATAKFKILPASFPLLDQVVQVLREYPKMRISIEGHTDNVGKDEANLDLSQRRAEAVRDYFVAKGIASVRLAAVGFGPTKPIASNKTPKGKAKNRRTELRVVALD